MKYGHRHNGSHLYLKVNLCTVDQCENLLIRAHWTMSLYRIATSKPWPPTWAPISTFNAVSRRAKCSRSRQKLKMLCTHKSRSRGPQKRRASSISITVLDAQKWVSSKAVFNEIRRSLIRRQLTRSLRKDRGQWWSGECERTVFPSQSVPTDW